EPLRPPAERLLERLYGERVLVDGPAELAHVPTAWALRIEGNGALADALRALAVNTGPAELPVLCQDAPDHAAALAWNRRCLKAAPPGVGARAGPGGRGYVTPPFLPGRGPCLACLLRHFQRLSPVPALYDDLVRHAQAGGAIPAVPF